LLKSVRRRRKFFDLDEHALNIFDAFFGVSFVFGRLIESLVQRQRRAHDHRRRMGAGVFLEINLRTLFHRRKFRGDFFIGKGICGGKQRCRKRESRDEGEKAAEA
jgi:hypothetical protein